MGLRRRGVACEPTFFKDSRKSLFAITFLLVSLFLSPQTAGNYTWQVNYTIVPLIQNVKPISSINMHAGRHGWVNVTEAYKLIVLKNGTNVYFKLMDTDTLIQHFTSLVVQIVIYDGLKAVVTLPLRFPEETCKYANLTKDNYNVDVRINYVAKSLTEHVSGTITVAIWAVEQTLSEEVGTYYKWTVNYTISP